MRVFWPIIEPARKFVRGWAIDAICEHLEAVTYGQISRLMINVPPGFSKSLTTNVFWPAWEWGPMDMPSMRFISASYNKDIPIRDNIKFRQIISSPMYREFWGKSFGPSSDSFNIIKVANNQTGWKLATSVGGVGTGERADRFVCDDPNSVKEAESEPVRRETNRWFREVVPTRMNDPEQSVIVLIQQRTHEDDVSGMILEAEHDMGYVHLCIPMEYEQDRHCVTVALDGNMIWEDPRGLDEFGARLEGNALADRQGKLAWPERFPQHVVDDLKATLGPYAASAQLQQAPTPRGGSIFKTEWWQLWPPAHFPKVDEPTKLEIPLTEYRVASLDPAFEEKEENDFSALTVWGVFRGSGSPGGAERQIAPRPHTLARFGGSNGAITIAGGPLNQAIDELPVIVPPDEAPKIILLHAWQKRLDVHGPPEERPPGITDAEWAGSYYLPLRQRTWGIVEWTLYTCRLYKVDMLLIENTAQGKPVHQELRRMYSNEDFGIRMINPGRLDKVARAYAVQHLFSNGLIYLPWNHQTNSPLTQWASQVYSQMASFPKSAHKDLVDSSTQALRYLRDTGIIVRSDEYDAAYADSLQPKKPPGPLYDT